MRGVKNKYVRSHLIELSKIFQKIYSKVASPQDLIELEREVPLTLCHLEKIFPPSFFDVIVHFVVHLATKARIAGPSVYRNMYPIERYLSKLKSYVKNRN